MERDTVATDGDKTGVQLISVQVGRSASTPFDIYWERQSANGFVLIVTMLIVNHNHTLTVCIDMSLLHLFWAQIFAFLYLV